MSYSSELTKERILTAAREEFLDKGFIGANLRSIASEAKVTTGALYNHYKNKEELFNALVRDSAEELLAYFRRIHEIDGEYSEHTMEHSSKGTDEVLDFIYDHFTEFKLIFCRSEGTAYDDYMDQLIEIEEKSYVRMLRNMNLDKKIDSFFLHVVVGSGINNLKELVSHDIPREQAIIFMEQIKTFRFAGWKSLLS